MKALLILSLILLVGCNAAPGSSPTTSLASNPTNVTPTNSTTTTISRVDNVVQHKVYDVTDGNSGYYTSANTFADNETFTIPHTITLTNNSTGSIIDGDNFVEIELVNQAICTYLKSGNTFTFDSCISYTSSIYWTIQAGDVYSVTDLNMNASVFSAHSINVVLRSTINTPRNGHITFEYDL